MILPGVDYDEAGSGVEEREEDIPVDTTKPQKEDPKRFPPIRGIYGYFLHKGIVQYHRWASQE